MKTIERFKNLFHQSTCYIIGSGASLNYVSPSFFEDKFTIGVNMAYKHFKCDFTIIHHHELAEQIMNDDQTLICSHFHKCQQSSEKYNINWEQYNIYMYYHPEQGFFNINFSPFTNKSKDSLFIGGATTVNAISFACFLGANNIVLCGVDGGSLNGKVNIDGYHNDKNYNQQKHAVLTNNIIAKVRDKLKQHNVNMYSLNPFVNMNLEGNKFNTFYNE